MIMKFRARSIFILFLLVVFFTGITASAASGDAMAFVAEGDALIKTKNYSEALSAYGQAIALDRNNFPAWNGKADALNRAGNFTDALDASDRALAIEPSNVSGWINRGYILYNLGRYDDELKAYETAVSLEPDNAEAWFNKGYSLAGLKRYDEAIVAFDRVKALQPDYPHLADNRRIAVQLRDAETPFFMRYATPIAGIILLLVAIGSYYLWRSRKQAVSEDPENETRQNRRRRERIG